MIAMILGSISLAIWQSKCPMWRVELQNAGTARPRDGPVSALSVAAEIDLFAACSQAGLSGAHAAGTVANLSSDGTKKLWTSIATLLALGVEARTAWAPAEECVGLRDLARLACSSERSGSALAEGCQRIAEKLRLQSRDDAVARAERTGVLIALPLSLCFLPAFFILGLAPIVINLASTMLQH